MPLPVVPVTVTKSMSPVAAKFESTMPAPAPVMKTPLPSKRFSSLP
jgi:hypothetical protein